MYCETIDSRSALLTTENPPIIGCYAKYRQLEQIHRSPD